MATTLLDLDKTDLTVVFASLALDGGSAIPAYEVASPLRLAGLAYAASCPRSELLPASPLSFLSAMETADVSLNVGASSEAAALSSVAGSSLVCIALPAREGCSSLGTVLQINVVGESAIGIRPYDLLDGVAVSKPLRLLTPTQISFSPALDLFSITGALAATPDEEITLVISSFVGEESTFFELAKPVFAPWGVSEIFAELYMPNLPHAPAIAELAHGAIVEVNGALLAPRLGAVPPFGTTKPVCSLELDTSSRTVLVKPLIKGHSVCTADAIFEYRFPSKRKVHPPLLTDEQSLYPQVLTPSLPSGRRSRNATAPSPERGSRAPTKGEEGYQLAVAWRWSSRYIVEPTFDAPEPASSAPVPRPEPLRE